MVQLVQHDMGYCYAVTVVEHTFYSDLTKEPKVLPSWVSYGVFLSVSEQIGYIILKSQYIIIPGPLVAKQ